jgi:hypothetical protein
MSTRNLPGIEGRLARETDNLSPFVSRRSRKCGSLDVSQPHGPQRPVTGIDLPLIPAACNTEPDPHTWLGTTYALLRYLMNVWGVGLLGPCTATYSGVLCFFRYLSYTGTRNRFQKMVSTFLSGNGRATTQAVGRRFRSQVRPCGICGWQSGNGARSLRVLRFPLPALILPTSPHSSSPSSSSSTVRGWYSSPNSGRSTKRTQSHPTTKY